MTIEVNSRQYDWVEAENVTGLLKRMNYIFPMVVVKIDGKLVPKPDYDKTVIADGSRVEVIHLISGG